MFDRIWALFNYISNTRGDRRYFHIVILRLLNIIPILENIIKSQDELFSC